MSLFLLLLGGAGSFDAIQVEITEKSTFGVEWSLASALFYCPKRSPLTQNRRIALLMNEKLSWFALDLPPLLDVFDLHDTSFPPYVSL